MSNANAAPAFHQDEYLPVPTTSLIHRKVALSDLFIRLPSDRMVKVAHKGGAIDMERLERFDEKDVQYLYVHKTELGGIVSDLVRGAEGLNQLPNVPADLKVAKFFNIAESVFSELINLPLSDESIGRGVRLSQEIATSMRERPEFLKLITSVVTLGDAFTRHSLGTVLMANMLVSKLDWSSPKLLAPITAGAFFHDIGLKEIPAHLHFKDPQTMTPDERKLWEEHPSRGVHLLTPLRSMTPDVLRIVQEHHEVPNGQGFPLKHRLERIFPMAKVVSLANVMAHDVFDLLESKQAFSADRFAQSVEKVYAPMYGSELTQAARLLFRPRTE